MKAFYIIFSIWGYNGTEWVYIGNQYVHNVPLTKIECEAIVAEKNWDRYEDNAFYRLSIECVEQQETEI